MLCDKYPLTELNSLLLPINKFNPFPKVQDRTGWESLPDDIKLKCIEDGERYLDFKWEPIHATLYMEYARNGDRSKYAAKYFSRREALCALVIAECIEDRGRFIDQIINGIWSICEETTWAIPAHGELYPYDFEKKGGQKADMVDGKNVILPDVNVRILALFACETGATLSFIHYLLKDRLDRVSWVICDRIKHEVKKRIIYPYIENDTYFWMGFVNTAEGSGNWTPWCNSNCLASVLLLEDDHNKRVAGVFKAMRILDIYISTNHDDGGCDEGPRYWQHAAGSLLDCLELLGYASNGQINIYNMQKIKELGRYIYRVHIDKDYFVNFADGPARFPLIPVRVFRYGRRIGDNMLSGLGVYTYKKQNDKSLVGSRSMFHKLMTIYDGYEMQNYKVQKQFMLNVWLKDTQVMCARENIRSVEGLYLAAKGGHNSEHHNHNDVGSFIVYYNGNPVLIDPGVGTYRSETFGPNRYSIWTMQSAYHNVPTVNGIIQQNGRQFAAGNILCSMDEGMAEFSADIGKAYPKEAGIKTWQRTCRLVRGESSRIEIIEDFELFNDSEDIVLNFMTACEPSIEYDSTIGLYTYKGGKLFMKYMQDGMKVTFEKIEIKDETLYSAWGESIYRIKLTAFKPSKKAKWCITITR